MTAPIKPIHSEWSIQCLLFEHLCAKQHTFIFPNVHLAYWEADLISVTKAGYINEYEIKLTRSDYTADFNKESKHKWLSMAKELVRNKDVTGVPAYFWYVAPEGIIDTVPEYAGQIEIRWLPETWFKDGVCEIKRAPRLHSAKISLHQKEKVYRSAQWKLWNARRTIAEIMQMQRLFKHIKVEL